MPTIISLTGALVPHPIPPDFYRGELWQPPNVHVPLLYPNTPTAQNFLTSAEMLYEEIVNGGHALPITAVGHSMGGQVINLLIALYGAELAALLGDLLTLIITGDPENRFGGVSAKPNTLLKTQSPNLGLPEDVHGLNIIVGTKQYDFFADYPDNWLNQTAIRNLGGPFGPIHGAYEDVGLLDPDNLAYRESGSTVTYMLFRTAPLPMLKVFTWLDGLYRARVESAYRRPPYVKLSELGGPEDPPPAVPTPIREQCPGSGQPSATRPQGRAAVGSPATGTCPSCGRPVPVEARLFSWRVRKHFV